MYLEIISPEFTLFSGEVTSVAVPGVDGEFEMLNNHASIVSTLKKGTIKIYGDITIEENLCLDVSKIAQGLVLNNYNSIFSGDNEIQNAISHKIFTR